MDRSSPNSITWPITQFSTNLNRQKSPSFTVTKANGEKVEFVLKLVQNQRPTDSDGMSSYTFIALQLCSEKENILARYRFGILNVRGDLCFVDDATAKYENSTNSSCNGLYNMKRKNILDSGSEFLKDDTLSFYCEVDINAQSSYQLVLTTAKLSQDLALLLERAKFSDVRLVVEKEVEGKGIFKKEFKAHKDILSCRSPVFGAMFEHKNTKEAQEDQVIITDVQPEVFEEFIRFVYTGTVADLGKYASDLLIVADKYQIDSLKSLCSHYLSSMLNTKTVAVNFDLADRHNASELKSKCIDYIVEHASEVMATKDWKLIKHKPDLLEQLFQMSSQLVKKFRK